MDDYMWTTRETETETINDDEARVLFHEQMRRRIAEMKRIEMERLQRQRQERAVAAESTQEWGQQVARVRDTRNRMLGVEWPEGDDKKEIGFLQDFIDGKLPKKEKILKPLPDELFEID